MAEAVADALIGQLRIEQHPQLDDGIHGLAEQWPHRPYNYLPGTSSRSQSAYVVEAMRKAEEKGAVSFAVRQGAELAAILQFETLAWDSDVLGFPVGRISWLIDRPGAENRPAIRAELLKLTLEEAERRGIRYLLARVPARDVEAAQTFERYGFELLDGLLTFGTALLEQPVLSQPENSVRCRPFIPQDLPALREIASSSFSIDRFHADPAISQAKADELHRHWLENSCAGFADCVLVAEDGEPVGFTTLKVDRSSETDLGVCVGCVVLVATAGRHRRKGAARLLTLSALRWFSQAGCQWVEVGTQLANVEASRVYQAAGFKLVSSSLTFRKLL